MEIASFKFLEDEGTDWEAEEEVSVLAIQHTFDTNFYYLVNAHRGDHKRFEIYAEEIPAMIEALQWAQEHSLAHPPTKSKDEQFPIVPRPTSEPEGEDG